MDKFTLPKDFVIPKPLPTQEPRTEKDIEKEYDARIARGDFIHEEECLRYGTPEQIKAWKAK